MPTFSFRTTFAISGGPGDPSTEEPTQRFAVDVPPDASAEVVVDLYGRRVHVQIDELEISGDFAAWLTAPTQRYINEYPPAIAPLFNDINSKLTDAARRVVETLKYFIGLRKIGDAAVSQIADVEWSNGVSPFRRVPVLMRAFGKMTSDIHLSARVVEMLQKCLDNGWTPLLAMRHLYRAIQEPTPRFKWIDATIAAELAVKEALQRKHPDIRPLLIHMPSPPLHKLYGELLEHYLGERSPYLKTINEGVKRRNELVHQPTDTQVTREEADKYVDQIMKAIHHLYGLIYPDWELKEIMDLIRH
ncbi:MAG TPA: hypothetical protein VFY35_02350 [Burkholderiaceae bacterium]|nr:hypothetical protein [Burkholderiaceae bacterium]